MPIYNGAFFLKETLDSLVNQSFKDFELICIDDGSTDHSLEILNHYAKRYEFIRVYRKQNEGTAAKAVNYGLQYVRSEFFMYSSQDDLFDKNLLEINYLKAKETYADAVVPNTIFYYSEDNASEGIFGLNKNYSHILSGNQAFSFSLNWEITGFVLWKTELLNKIGGKFFDFSINSDEYTTRLLYFFCQKVVFTQTNFYYRQNNPHSITKKWNPRLLESFITLDWLEKFIIEKAGGRQDDLDKLRETYYHELMRITSIFYKNKKGLDGTEFSRNENYLKSIYNANHHKLQNLKFASVKKKTVLSLIRQNYYALKMYHLFVNAIK